MIRDIIEEAAALVSVSMFIATLALWAVILGA